MNGATEDEDDGVVRARAMIQFGAVVGHNHMIHHDDGKVIRWSTYWCAGEDITFQVQACIAKDRKLIRLIKFEEHVPEWAEAVAAAGSTIEEDEKVEATEWIYPTLGSLFDVGDD